MIDVGDGAGGVKTSERADEGIKGSVIKLGDGVEGADTSGRRDGGVLLFRVVAE